MKSAFYEDGDLEIVPYIIVLVILVMCRAILVIHVTSRAT